MITFAFMPAYEGDEREAMLLARNLTQVVQGPDFLGAPILLLYPAHLGLSAELNGALQGLPVQTLPFEIPQPFREFPLAQKVFAAAQAEAYTHSELLVWMDSDTLIVQPPASFCLPAGKNLAGCPVHLKNISSPADQTPDDFWQLIYSQCQTPPERIFSVTTLMDKVTVRAHFNAGCLVVRPELGLLAAWKANFETLAHQETLTPFYQQRPLYQFFVHQAVLAATILARFRQDEIVVLPEEYNYPVFLQEKFKLTPPTRPVTMRYDRYEFLEVNPAVLESIKKDPKGLQDI
jgi:hypothetical protein